MMEFYVSGQSLKIFTPVIAADSLSYLSAKVHFADSQWEGCSKWLHFRRDEGLGAVSYDMQLNEDDEISAAQKLNLTVGQWEVYLTGTIGESRLTTLPIIITVQRSGLIDAPLHELPLSVAEQVDYNASQALLFASSVKQAAEAGEFDGRDGTSLAPIGHFENAEELAAGITDPAPGDVYSVGAEPPHDIYIWDGVNRLWRDHGQLQGAPGVDGAPGATFIPSVDANGNISWLNDKGLANPVTRNIMGPAGKDGAVGPAGPGAYEKAQEAGYTGTEEGFYSALGYMPYHNKRHLPDGADPIIVENGNIADGAITAAKVAEKYRTRYIPLTLSPEGWSGDTAPYIQRVEAEGLLEGDIPKAYFVAPEDFALLEDSQEAYACLYGLLADDGFATFQAKERPGAAVDVMLEVTRI